MCVRLYAPVPQELDFHCERFRIIILMLLLQQLKGLFSCFAFVSSDVSKCPCICMFDEALDNFVCVLHSANALAYLAGFGDAP